MPTRDEASAPRFRAWFDAAPGCSPAERIARLQTNTRNGVTTLLAPGMSISAAVDTVHLYVGSDSITLSVGAPQFQGAKDANPSRALAAALLDRSPVDGRRIRGRYLIAHFDLTDNRSTVATDRFSVYPVCFAIRGSELFISDRADSVPLPDPPELDRQSIFNYLYFHVIPAPRTIFKDVWRLAPSHLLTFDAQGAHVSRTWHPEFNADESRSFDDLKQEFWDLAIQAVAREATTPNIGAFLSGGTDSSTVVGMMSKLLDRPASTFSIGFDAEGYDEMSYARIAARHFKANQHEYYVKPSDLLVCIPMVARQYDQPFGNSSAVPAFLCAKLAREHGVEKMLAGDGGDELFGGNTRYAKQKVFEAYNIAPAALRKHLFEPLLLGVPKVRRFPILSKVASFVEQARLPMPDRMETYNLLDHFGAVNVLRAEFLDGINPIEPRELQRGVYGEIKATSMVDCMLAFDWRFTLADCDLPKVVGSARLAGEFVGFPFLDDDLLDFSLRLSPALKVKGLKLRYFFKQALREFLPDEIIRKRKHGFGLPFGPWLLQNPDLSLLARTSLEGLADRGILRTNLIGDLFSSKLAEHAGYYGELIWILMMLEQWLQGRAENLFPRQQHS